MKMLTSFGDTIDADDFNFVPAGEIVYEGIVVCCNSRTCGCDRSFAGTITHKATTIAVVTDVDMDSHDLFDLAARCGRESGWGGDLILASLRAVQKDIEDMPVGTILRHQFNHDTEIYEYTIIKEGAAA